MFFKNNKITDPILNTIDIILNKTKGGIAVVICKEHKFKDVAKQFKKKFTFYDEQKDTKQLSGFHFICDTKEVYILDYDIYKDDIITMLNDDYDIVIKI